MKRIITFLLAAVILFSCIPTAHASGYDKSNLLYDDAFSFLTLLNQKRASIGLGAVTMDRSLLDGASIRAYEQTIVFGHTRPDGSKYSTVAPKMAHAECVHYWYPAEQSTPQSALQAFMDSPPHRAILLDGQYRSVGVGVYESGDRKNWAVVLSMYSAADQVSLSDMKPRKTVAGFNDVFETDYYASPVQWAAQKQITNGTSGTTFEPNAMCTRAQIVTFLWRAAGSPSSFLTASKMFSDVTPGSYFEKAVSWALEKGITSGTGTHTFSPNTPCTRAETTTFLWRLKGCPAATTANPFKDVSASKYYSDAVLWAVREKITAGTDESHFSPYEPCTRCQAVTFLQRADNVPNRPAVSFGDKGRFYIGSHSVALYNSLSQAVVDNTDSAFYYVLYGTIIIGDHNNQGFDIIKQCNEGDRCYILHEDGSREEFVCRRIDRNAQNITSDVIDSNGQSAFRAGFDMFTMTCNDSGCHNVTIVYWDRV